MSDDIGAKDFKFGMSGLVLCGLIALALCAFA
jgi:hypothetical protein